MKTSYVLIDYENVQPKNMGILVDQPFKVIVFVGANQAKVSFDVASSLQALGGNAEYIKISGNGSNALDFHIAFYIGQLSQTDPGGNFHIISKDTGFDPLIKYMKERKINVRREADLAEIPLLRISNSKSATEKVDAVVKNLSIRGHSRPRKTQTLANTINSLFMKSLEEEELNELIKRLCDLNYVKIKNEKVSYLPPISQ